MQRYILYTHDLTGINPAAIICTPFK